MILVVVIAHVRGCAPAPARQHRARLKGADALVSCKYMKESLALLLLVELANPNLQLGLVLALPEPGPIRGIAVFRHNGSRLREANQMVLAVVIQGLGAAHDHVAAQIVKVGLAESGLHGLLPRVAVSVSRAAPFDAGGDVSDRIVRVTPRKAGVSFDPVQIVISDARAADVGHVICFVVPVILAQNSRGRNRLKTLGNRKITPVVYRPAPIAELGHMTERVKARGGGLIIRVSRSIDLIEAPGGVV